MNKEETLIPKVGVITDVRIDTPDIKTFRVVTPDGKKVFQHRPIGNVAHIVRAFYRVDDAHPGALLCKFLCAAFADAAEITAKEFNSFGNVVYAASFRSASKTYYAFFSKPLSYEDSAMSICTVIDEKGAIAKQSILEMAFGHGVEYMPGIQDYVNSSAPVYKDYLNKFNGITDDTLSDSILIANATVTSTAVKLATADAFAAFNSINEGGAQ